MRKHHLKLKVHSLVLAFLAITSTTLAHAMYQWQPTPKIAPKVAKIVHVGKASWYSENDPGINPRTANNERFNDDEFTCAMWDVPFNQLIKVTNMKNGKSIIVRVNDRGPHKRFVHQGRMLDLTKNAFAQIAPLRRGLIDVQIEFLDS